MKKIFIGTMMFLILMSLSAQQVVNGEIVYIEGDVNISRRGEMLPFYEVDMGLPIQEEDIVRTGFDGYVEIELSYPQQGTLLKIQPDTTFYFETRRSGGKSTSRINLLNGTIGLKVSKLASNENMNVDTQSAVMGIRGTEFDVNKAPTGEILVTCKEGKVSCATPAMETFSEPGKICEQNDGQDFSTLGLPVDELDGYREKWWTTRMDALSTLGPLAAEYYSARYKRQIVLFDDAWNRMEDEQRLFREYEQLIDRGVTPTAAKATQDKITLTTPAIKMRSALPLMEEIFYTMLVLEEYHSRGIYSDSSQFFKEFNKRKDSLEKDIILARYYMTLYAKISRFAGGGNGSILDDMMSDSPF